jgi:hypothetical protein
MYVDGELRFSNEQAVTASAGSTNLIDLKVAGMNPGVGEPGLWAVFVVTEAFTDSGSDSTVAVTLETDNDVAFGSPTTAVQTVGTFAALSAIGSVLIVRLQPFSTLERYMRAYYTLANGNLSTGKITSFLTPNVDKWRANAQSVTIIA